MVKYPPKKCLHFFCDNIVLEVLVSSCPQATILVSNLEQVGFLPPIHLHASYLTGCPYQGKHYPIKCAPPLNSPACLSTRQLVRGSSKKHHTGLNRLIANKFCSDKLAGNCLRKLEMKHSLSVNNVVGLSCVCWRLMVGRLGEMAKLG